MIPSKVCAQLFAVSLAVASTASSIVLAAAEPAVTRAADLDKAAEFDIAAQPLSSALLEFARQTSIQVLTQSESLDGYRTRGIAGRLRAGDALAAILAGTGLSYRKIGGSTVTIETPSAHISQAAPAPTQSSIPGSTQQNASSYNIESGDGKGTKLDEIVVTGTHIVGSTIASPVITITRQDIENSGFTTATQLINSLPQSFGGGSPQVLGT